MKDSPITFDMHLLWEASRKLQGYFLHTWFEHYLALLSQNLHTWVTKGFIGPNALPTKPTNYRQLFDFNSINFEKLSYIIGIYMYILSCHKWSNYYLMQDNKKKRVLYLRGYDYEGAIGTSSDEQERHETKYTPNTEDSPEQWILKSLHEHAAGSGFALGLSSIDTISFNEKLTVLLGKEYELYKVLSPRDLWWETIGPQRFFYGDYDKLISASNKPIHSIYLNALHWEEDISSIVNRTDYFIVYVSTITSSSLWELNLLKEKNRAKETTVVFDEKAIRNKGLQANLHDYMQQTFGNDLRWVKDIIKEPNLTVEELREYLSKDFFVVSPEEFSNKINIHKSRINIAINPGDSNTKRQPIEFKFFPSLEDKKLELIRDFDHKMELNIKDSVRSKSITNLPWFLNNIQFRIYTSLLLGRHDNTGRALAMYAAVMEGTRRHLLADAKSSDLLVVDTGKAEEVLHEHFEFSKYAAPTILGYGKSNEFDSNIKQATAEYEELFTSTSEAVDHYYDKAKRLGKYIVTFKAP